jgi:hypothetical protein
MLTCVPAMTQTDLKGLSGGERSYATLAFTMALENVISVPFCCLDEFDVVGCIVCRLHSLSGRPSNQSPNLQRAHVRTDML